MSETDVDLGKYGLGPVGPTRLAIDPDSPKPEMVNHPKHYNMHPSGVECIEIIRHMPHNIGAAMKYLWRMDHKDAPIEDLQKAIWYIQDEIALREGKFKK